MTKTPIPAGLKALKTPLRLTWAGLLAERVTQAFWPLWTVLLAIWAVLMFETLADASKTVVWGAVAVAAIALTAASFYAARRFRWPSQGDAMARLDAAMPGNPITAYFDSPAIGREDSAALGVWQAHLARMEDKLRDAKPVGGDLRVSPRDPYALRYIALLGFVMALGFGSVWRSDVGLGPATAGSGALATGPSWEIWIEPPLYTGKPSLYLNDIEQTRLSVPKGSDVIVRLYGDLSQLTLTETISDGAVIEPGQPSYDLTVEQAGNLAIDGADGARWDIGVLLDARPTVEMNGALERKVNGELALPFAASDDYSVERGQVKITLDLPGIERRYGQVVDPEARPDLILDLPMPFAGDRSEFTETLIENLSEHPWAGLAVQFELTVEDALDQSSDILVVNEVLPGRRFFQPIAKAVVEQRRDILWSMENAERVGDILRTITFDPEGFFPNEQAFLTIRRAITILDLTREYGLDLEKRDEVAEMLWNAAMLLELGRVKDALERLQRAQERLSEAMKDGATDEEIGELMQELSEAMQEYMNQLAQNSEPQDQQNAQNQQSQEITGDQLQEMLDRIQELMEEGRMEEAEQLLAELMEMMENMQVAEGQPGQGQQGQQGQQSMEDLQQTLRDQQGLSDEAFRDLQEQFNPDAQAGENEDNEGRNGGQGRGQSHEGQGGQGQAEGQGDGQEGQDGQQGSEGSLADRQEQLRRELNRQRQNLPGAGTPEGDAAREALGRAGEAMDDAEEALRDDRTADALGAQSEAMDALREGLRNLGEAMAQQQQGGQQGQNDGQFSEQTRDPLGRDSGQSGQIGSEGNMLQSEDSRRKARELMDEIRKRSSEQNRPELEKDYLNRLLDRF